MTERSTELRSRQLRLRFVMFVVAGLCGCAKSPTVILTDVEVDNTVPPLLLLRAILVSETDASRQASVDFVSLVTGDAANRPAPYVFPLRLPVTVPPTLAGPVTLTILGLDYDTQAVLARGEAQIDSPAGRQTSAAVTLTGGGGDGGAGGGGGDGGAGFLGDALDEASTSAR